MPTNKWAWFLLWEWAFCTTNILLPSTCVLPKSNNPNFFRALINMIFNIIKAFYFIFDKIGCGIYFNSFHFTVFFWLCLTHCWIDFSCIYLCILHVSVWYIFLFLIVFFRHILVLIFRQIYWFILSLIVFFLFVFVINILVSIFSLLFNFFSFRQSPVMVSNYCL